MGGGLVGEVRGAGVGHGDVGIGVRGGMGEGRRIRLGVFG